MRKIIRLLLAISLKWKVLTGYFFMSALIVLVISIMGTSFLKIQAKYDALNAMSNDIQLINQLKADINGMRAAFLWGVLSDDPGVMKDIENVVASYVEKNNVNIALLKKGAYKDKVTDIEQSLVPFSGTMLNELIPLVQAGKRNEALNIVRTAQTERVQKFMALANRVIEDSKNEYVRSMESIKGEVRSAIIMVIVIIAVVFTIAFAGSFWFIRNYIIGVLHGISSSAEKVAAGDLTIKVEAKTGDEFGDLAKDVNRIIESMQTVLRDMAGKTVFILKDATSLTLYGRDVSQRVDRDLERTTSTAAATEEMSSSISDVAKNIGIMSQAAEHASAITSQGKGTIDETVASIGEVNRQVENASDKVKALAELSKKIDDAVAMIKDIADQTNLLALNAAIEAARAGEQGRGFAVVADEVRKLAQRTTEATADISAILSSIHSGTVDATKMMELAVGKARSTGENAQRLDESFKGIYESFEKVADMVHQIVSATEEQSATATEISLNLTTIADDAKESSQTVKDMARSFTKFSANAKEFLKLLDGFNDPKMKLGVVKADYVLWFHRLLDITDAEGITINPAELQPEQTRMGKWYYGDGGRVFRNVRAFAELESPHKKLHELGIRIYEASRKGDKSAVKQGLAEAMGLIDGIVNIVNRLEAEL